MNFYDARRKASKDIDDWVRNTNRDEWAKLVRRLSITYGYSAKVSLKILEEIAPGLTIIEDKLEMVTIYDGSIPD